MEPQVISVNHLIKHFLFPIKDPKSSWLKNLFNPQRKSITAVNNISFDIKKGERVAFIGPNGAGKSTTIKIMSGIIQSSSGKISVLGLNPKKDRKKLAYKIGTVFGQRSQLFANLPIVDSMEFFGTMYDLKNSVIKGRIKELSKLFQLDDFKDQPVRKLSLGQRMRAEVATALIHNPEIIFLDEPTIGLDIVAKKSLRELLIKINEDSGTTIFLTSHDVGDIEILANRTIIINNGMIVKDMPTQELSSSFIYEKFIDIIAKDKFLDFPKLPEGITYKEMDVSKITAIIDLHKIEIKEALTKISELFNYEDINIYSTDLETVIRHIYETDKNSVKAV